MHAVGSFVTNTLGSLDPSTCKFDIRFVSIGTRGLLCLPHTCAKVMGVSHIPQFWTSTTHMAINNKATQDAHVHSIK